jgi:uncharacterized protein YneF (UPF0154 family)
VLSTFAFSSGGFFILEKPTKAKMPNASMIIGKMIRLLLVTLFILCFLNIDIY